MNVPGNHNTCRATVMRIDEALDALVHPGKANGRIPGASGASPHPVEYEGNAAARGPQAAKTMKAPAIPDSRNGTKGMLA